jgi:hypothetical protein
MRITKSTRSHTLLHQLALLGAVLLVAQPAASEIKRVKSQTVYVPAYAHIYHGNKAASFQLAVTLSIRNTDPAHPITVMAIDYFDTDGRILKKYLQGDATLPPLGSTRHVIKESDKGGGSGANLIVKWRADAKVTAPIIETIMIGTTSQQGVSFTSRGEVIEEES